MTVDGSWKSLDSTSGSTPSFRTQSQDRPTRPFRHKSPEPLHLSCHSLSTLNPSGPKLSFETVDVQHTLRPIHQWGDPRSQNGDTLPVSLRMTGLDAILTQFTSSTTVPRTVYLPGVSHGQGFRWRRSHLKKSAPRVNS